MAELAEIYGLAMQYHRAGQLPQAEHLYRQILQANPYHADTLHLLGVLDYQRGRAEQAVDSIRRAIGLNPSCAGYYCNLGLAYQALNKVEDAAQAYRDVLRLEPRSAEAYGVLGNLYRLMGQTDEAIRHCRKALEIQPGFAGALNNLGLALSDQGKIAEALEYYQMAARAEPSYAGAFNNTAYSLAQLGRLEEAVTYYRQALRLTPEYAESHNGLGMVLDKLNRIDESAECFLQALRFKPNFPSACNNLGIARLKQGRSDEARRCFEHGVKLKPDHVDSLNNLATVLMEQGLLDDAVATYREALRVNPKYAEGYSNLGSVLQSQNKLDESVENFQEAIRLKPDFAQAHNNLAGVYLRQGRLDLALKNFHDALRIDPNLAAVRSSLLFCLNYDPDADADKVFAEHCAWGRQHQIAGPPSKFANDPAPERRLRIGYFSPDLRFHPLTRYFEPVLARHDRGKVEVFCYAEGTFADAVTARLQKMSNWRSTTRMTDAQIADAVRADRIDILVDLAGHTANNRLRAFALKPAPIQVTWLGYMNTTGLPAIDYRLTDDVLDPPGDAVRDTEKLLRLPNGMCCFSPPVDAPSVEPLPALRRGCLTFGSLHGLLRVNHRVYDQWAGVLAAVPNSRLLIFHDTVEGSAKDRIRREFANRGITADRLDLRQGSCAAGYLRVYDEIDISLDVFPWTGGVTTCESLWMGVPVLTLCGTRPTGRNTTALLTRVGLTDWVAHSPEEFAAIGKQQAADLDGLSKLRETLRERTNKSLCNAERFTAELEDAYQTMWRRWCSSR